MIKKILLFSTLILVTPMAFGDTATSPQDMFQQANQIFEKGDMDKALEIYQSLIAQGYEGPSLYYNIGNVYYRKGERGKSILWYERAAQLSPRDSDIQFNLTLARSHIRDDQNNLFQKLVFYFTANELAWVVFVLSWVFFLMWGAILMGWTKGELWPQLHMWLSGIMLFLSLSWLGTHAYLNRSDWGVVTAPPGEVRNGPGNDYAVGFTIPEGSKVIILNHRPEWVQVGVPQQGLKGWIPAADIEAVKLNSASLG